MFVAGNFCSCGRVAGCSIADRSSSPFPTGSSTLVGAVGGDGGGGRGGVSDKPELKAAAAVAGVGLVGGGTGLGVGSKMSFRWTNFIFFAGGAIAVSLLSQESK